MKYTIIHNGRIIVNQDGCDWVCDWVSPNEVKKREIHGFHSEKDAQDWIDYVGKFNTDFKKAKPIKISDIK